MSRRCTLCVLCRSMVSFHGPRSMEQYGEQHGYGEEYWAVTGNANLAEFHISPDDAAQTGKGEHARGNHQPPDPTCEQTSAEDGSSEQHREWEEHIPRKRVEGV